MKRSMILCIVGMLLIGTNLYAANGDLIVGGNEGIGTTDPSFGGRVSSKLSVVPLAGGAGLAIGYSATQPSLAINPGITGTWTMFDYAAGSWTPGITQKSGNVGIGTTTPQAKLDVGSSGGDIFIGYNYTGLSQVVKTFATGHSASNVPSQFNVGISDGSGAVGMQVFDVRDGSYNSQYIQFLTHHGGVSVGPRMTVDKDGNVGIGTTSPYYKLDVNGLINSLGFMVTTISSGAQNFLSTASGSNGAAFVGQGFGPATRAFDGFAQSYDFYAHGPGVHYGVASSIRWKRNIQNIDNALSKVLNMRGVYYDWDEEHGGKHAMGFIAEEVGRQVPEIVGYEEDGVSASGMDYGAMTPILVQAIKEQQAIIEQMKTEIKELKVKLGQK